VRILNQTASIISTYTADVSGVASALYELGGMTVIHDASGCNSTYNTHDEPRWYDMDSAVFISALTEINAVMGNDRKLVDDIVRAAKELHPKFIALCGTPIPMMVGFDFEAVASLVENETGIPSFGIPTNGMHTYVSGAGQAFACLAKRMVKNLKKEKIRGEIRINILGETPLDFSVTGMADSLMSAVEAAGFPVLSDWAMNGHYGEKRTEGWQCACPGKANLAAIERAALADVNLVVSSAGLPAAKILKERFGTPYVTGIPIGKKGMEKLAEKIRAAAAGTSDETENIKNEEEKSGDRNKIFCIYEPVIGQSIAEAIWEKEGKQVQVLCPVPAEDYGETEETDPFLRDGIIHAEDEDELTPYLKNAGIVIADPMYRPICPADAGFISLPHEAFSGRIYRRDIPDLVMGIPGKWKLRL